MSTLITRLIYERFVSPADNALWKSTKLSPLKETLLGTCPQERLPVHGHVDTIPTAQLWEEIGVKATSSLRILPWLAAGLPPFAIILPFVWVLLLPGAAQWKWLTWDFGFHLVLVLHKSLTMGLELNGISTGLSANNSWLSGYKIREVKV